MALKEAYEFMQKKGILIFDSSEHKIKINDTLDLIKFGKVNVRYHSDELIDIIKDRINNFGENEIAWIYFGKHRGVYIPMELETPNVPIDNSDTDFTVCYNNPYVETTLKYALKIFTIVGEKSNV